MLNFFSKFFSQKYSEGALTGIKFSLFDRFLLCSQAGHSFILQSLQKNWNSKILQISTKINVAFYQA